MAYNLIISTVAEEDAAGALEYYDLINPKLGDRFLSELYEIYNKIKLNPDYYSFISSQYKFRDIKLKSFPYVVIYEVHLSDIIVLAVLNTHTQPRKFDI